MTTLSLSGSFCILSIYSLYVIFSSNFKNDSIFFLVFDYMKQLMQFYTLKIQLNQL
jgi:hypothetical protein